MPANASAGTEVIPLPRRSSLPPSVGQEPDRTSGEPSESPLKLQLPNPTVQGKAEALLDAARSPSSASNIFWDPEMPIVIQACSAVVDVRQGSVISSSRQGHLQRHDLKKRSHFTRSESSKSFCMLSLQETKKMGVSKT